MPLTNTIAAASARGFGFGTEDAFGEQIFTSPGTYAFIVPAGVTSISTVAVAGGGGGVTPGNYAGSNSMPITFATPPGSISGTVYAGGGGALAYTNNISVTPGQVLTVVVGSGGQPGSVLFTAGDGGESYVANAGGTKLVHVTGGYGGQTGGGGGSVVVGTGGAGGAGGVWSTYEEPGGVAAGWRGAGGGGGGGYSGAGGAGGNANQDGSNGTGGGAGGGGGGANVNYSVSGTYQQYIFGGGGAGGGVGLFGLGSNGSGGVKTSGSSSNYTPATGGGGGSGGTSGADSGSFTIPSANEPGPYGGGGAIPGTSVRQYPTAPEFREFRRGSATFSSGANGAVRIIWTTNPTVTRAFPSTNVGQL